MISVIVPIYNTEKYLPKCLDSLAAQTYPDVEFILIDDGSTDNSGAIAEKYTDPRFRVFHTGNHGLSAARNFGIEKARGEWLMFVDSDDWVEPGFCEIPYQAAVQYDADVVIFSIYKIKTRKVKRDKRSSTIEIIDFENAIRCGGVGVLNKLFKRELFTRICFPEDRVYEEIATTHKILMLAKRIVMIPDTLYYYVYRKDSISHCFSIKNKRDALISSLEKAEELGSFGCAEDVYKPGLISSAITFLVMADPSEDRVYLKAGKIADSVKGIPSYISWKRKVLLWVWKTNKPLFHLIRRTLNRLGVFQP